MLTNRINVLDIDGFGEFIYGIGVCSLNYPSAWLKNNSSISELMFPFHHRRKIALGLERLVSRASLVYEIIIRFSRDFYETILVGKFPSRKISEKCASHRS